MTNEEILEAWEELWENEAFEAFDSEWVDPDQVEAVLGKSVAADYSTWMYLFIK